MIASKSVGELLATLGSHGVDHLSVKRWMPFGANIRRKRALTPMSAIAPAKYSRKIFRHIFDRNMQAWEEDNRTFPHRTPKASNQEKVKPKKKK